MSAGYAKTLIIAAGERPRKLGLPEEKRLSGKGVAYCATCDAPLFAGVDVAVAGGGNSALEAAMDLIKIANSVHIVSITPLTADPIYQDEGLLPNSDIVKGVLNLNQYGEIVVDYKCHTEVPGVFACGDVTNVPFEQVIVAAGEGAKAALAAYEYLISGN